MKQRLILTIVLMALLITGCWNRRELNDLAIAVAFGVDKAGDQYRISVQVVDPGEVAANKGVSGRTPVTMYHMTAPTLFEALRKMTTVSPRKIYASHLRIFVIGEEVAKEGIGEVLDLVTRDQEMRTDFYLVVARGKHTAEEALKILTSSRRSLPTTCTIPWNRRPRLGRRAPPLLSISSLQTWSAKESIRC